MGIAKVVYGGTILLDLTNDTVAPSHLETNFTAHNASGTAITGILSPSGGSVIVQPKNAVPYTTNQVIYPDEGYNYLTQVNIAAIAYTETLDAKGGTIVTIGTVAPS